MFLYGIFDKFFEIKCYVSSNNFGFSLYGNACHTYTYTYKQTNQFKNSSENKELFIKMTLNLLLSDN